MTSAFTFFLPSDTLSRTSMQSDHKEPYALKEAGLWLKLSIHADAVRADPRAYLIAAWWRLCGKRLRSRSQFAGLLGRSRRAYELWMLWHEETVPPRSSGGAGPPIVALVDIRGTGQVALAESLLSLSNEGIMALPVGAADIPTLTHAARQIDWTIGPWLMPIAAGDTVARGTAQAYRNSIAGTNACLAYADDDLLDQSGRRTTPHFKPDWNSEMFRHFDYLTGACILQVTQEELQSGVGAADWLRQLVALRAGEARPLHVRKVLHHRRTRPVPHIPAAGAVSTANLPPVSIIVPTRNRVDLLRTCLNGIAATNYPDTEVIVVDNDSDDPETLDYLASLDPARYRVLRHAGAFNYSAINNRAVELARGQLLCLLNNDIEVIQANWLAIMATQAMRDNVGAVGAQLLYPDGRIQHAGVVLGMGNAAGHAHRLLRPDEEGYFRRHALPQFTSAVTAACLVVQRERFLAVGGLNEREFAVAFNDVDLCLRLNAFGWQSLYEPRATLIHHESVSRGLDRDPVGAKRFAGELAALKQRWKTEERIDRYHHPELSRVSERFVTRL